MDENRARLKAKVANAGALEAGIYRILKNTTGGMLEDLLCT
jgi:hypothetical protein